MVLWEDQLARHGMACMRRSESQCKRTSEQRRERGEREERENDDNNNNAGDGGNSIIRDLDG